MRIIMHVNSSVTSLDIIAPTSSVYCVFQDMFSMLHTSDRFTIPQQFESDISGDLRETIYHPDE